MFHLLINLHLGADYEHLWDSAGLGIPQLLPDMKNWLIVKDPDAGKDWRQEKKETTEDEMVGWHHRLDGHDFEQALGVGDGLGNLRCCNPWVHKE